MVNITLSKKLKNKSHKQVALNQDLLVSELYTHFPETVIHGGTAIWRCYSGNRFSEDIDVYLKSLDKEKVEKFSEKLEDSGFEAQKLKFTNNAIFSKFKRQGEIVRFEAIEKNIKNYSTKKFEMVDGGSIIVNTLSPAQLIKEKVGAYLGRKKIRDLYDIYFLFEFVDERENIKKDLNKLLENYKPPVDENDIKTLIITGAVPNTEDMLREIKRWAR